jgi:carboxyl-terminal processing protease
VEIPESERALFKTRNGRPVYDGGGVKPDIVLPKDTATGVVKALLDQFLVFDFATKYAAEHSSIDSIEVFSFTDWEGFRLFVKEKKFKYETESEKKLKELKEVATREKWAVLEQISAMEQAITAEKEQEMERNKAAIISEIESEIVGRYFFQRGKVRKSLVNDPEIKAAVDLLNDSSRYQKILSGK